MLIVSSGSIVCLTKLREVLRDEGFEIYTDEKKGDFTFIEAREL
jgi:hypothetical protein